MALVGGSIGNASGPAFSAYIADWAQGADRTRGFTWYRIGFNAGYSAGVSLGGFLVVFVGFSGAVLAGAGVIAVATVALYLLLEPSPTDRARRLPAGLRDPTPGAAPGRKSLSESLRTLARDRVALELVVAFTLASFVIAQWAITFPLFVHNVLGLSYPILGAGLALNGLVVVFGQKATTDSVIGRRHTTIGILGLALYVVGYLALGAAGEFALVPVAVFFVAVVVVTLGENLVTIPSATLPSNIAPPDEVGAYNGAFQTLGGVGFLLAILAGGLVLSATTSPLLIWLLLVAPALPAILVLRHAGGRLPIPANTA